MAEVKGLLLINLGSPNHPTPTAVRRYLTEFLTDRFVIDVPWLVRQALVRVFIAPMRAAASAHAYSKIWNNGSPLLQHTQLFAEGVAQTLADRWEVRWAARYGEPSIQRALQDWHVNELFVVPLYPQYAESSSRTAIEKSREMAAHYLPHAKVQFLPDFFVEPEYVRSECKLIQEQILNFKPDHLLLSFHGLPEHHMTKLHPQHCLKRETCCDEMTEDNRWCYRAQCVATTRAIQKGIDFDSRKISMSFQSRLGRRPWIKPYTDLWVNELATNGVKRLLVTCPSFVADCLETLEEVQMRLREQFISQGGEDLQLVPALNAHPHWIENFCKMVERPDLSWVQ